MVAHQRHAICCQNLRAGWPPAVLGLIKREWTGRKKEKEKKAIMMRSEMISVRTLISFSSRF
jgi:hypothetical protein